MITVEIYLNEMDLLSKMIFPSMIRLGEYISIFKDDHFTYYRVNKIWYRLDEGGTHCTPCAEVAID